MTLLVLLLLVAVIVLWSSLSGLSNRVEALSRQLIQLADRTTRLEASSRRESAAPARPEAHQAPAAVTSTPVAAAVPPTPALTSVPTPAPATAPVPAPASAPAPVPPPAPPTPAAPPDLPVERLPPLPSAPDAEAEPESWEIVVGTSWLNKIGVLTFVIGIALLVGYSFTQIGPLGRVAIGAALSGGLLVTGVLLERREGFRSYAYGLVGGGWAGLYFTAFATHEIDGARIVHDEVTAVSLLGVVAAGMVAHSLRYRSQVVTSLAFIVAYATLSLTPLSGFAVVASMPLAASLVLVAQRFGWTGLALLGVAASYGSFVLRGAAFPDAALDPYSALPYVTLAAYWLTFEISDIVGARAGRRAGALPAGLHASILAPNAAGVSGALLVTLPPDRGDLWSTCLFVVGAAYLASALLRGRIAGPADAKTDHEPVGSHHLATAIAAAFFAAGIGVRLSGTRETLAYLLEAQLLFVAGLTLSDRHIRRIGSVAGVIASVHAAFACLPIFGAGAADAYGFAPTSAVALLVAAVWLGNSEWLARRDARRGLIEAAYPWMAIGLVGLVVLAESSPAYEGTWLIGIGWVLLEVSRWRGRAFAMLGHAMGWAGAYLAVMAFATPPDSPAFRIWGAAPSGDEAWTGLLSAVAVAAIVAWRVSSSRFSTSGPSVAAATWTTAATGLLLLFEWRVSPAEYLGLIWAVTGLSGVAAGLASGQAALRWLGYLVVGLGTVRIAAGVFGDSEPGATAIVHLCLVSAALYALSLTVRRANRRDGATASARPPEDVVADLAAFVATACVAALVIREVEASVVTFGLGLHGLGLLGAGLLARDRLWRLLGLGLLFAAILKVFFYDLRELDALPRIFSFVVLGLILLGISWTYTRYRETIRKLL